MRAIAASIDRLPSTISRELHKSGGPVSYHPELAERNAAKRQQGQEKLWLLLCRRKIKRGMRRSRPAKSTATKAHITKRPAEAENRTEVGHCEADLVFCSGSQKRFKASKRHYRIFQIENIRTPGRMPFAYIEYYSYSI